jgi:alpha-beta hydrolase superfamily lysophospholipase
VEFSGGPTVRKAAGPGPATDDAPHDRPDRLHRQATEQQAGALGYAAVDETDSAARAPRHATIAMLSLRAALGRAWWLLRWPLGLLVGGSLVLALGFSLFAVSALAPLEPWHRETLDEEFKARQHRGLDFDGYLQQEQRLFDELRRVTAGWDAGRESYALSRFNPAAPLNRLADDTTHNRSFRLTPASPVGQALLMHGLTDSPHSMRAMADALSARGFEVTVLRLPGHGTLPSMLVDVSMADWTAAVELAARDVASRLRPGQPYYLGGYSTGATLALLHTLQALQDPSLARPSRVLLMSPAIEITSAALLAEVIDFFAVLPVPLLEKVRWQSVEPEFDPVKYNSFPVNGSRQVKRATRALRAALDDAAAAGRLAGMPPVITWQSVVDSTVGAVGTVDTLYARLPGPAHRLVMFDVNRLQALVSVQRPAARTLIERAALGQRGYTLDVVSNRDAGSSRIAVHRLAPDGGKRTIDTTLDWPTGIVSLGHVAMPFRPDDSVYGFLPGSGRDGIPSIGSLLLRGESGALTVSLGSLTRLRSNPFWPLIEADVADLVADDLTAARR